MLNRNGDGTHSFRVFGVWPKSDVRFNDVELVQRIKDLRGALRKASWDDEEPWDEYKNYRYKRIYDLNQLKDDLILMAIRGYRFYTRFTQKVIGGVDKVNKFSPLMLKPAIMEFAIKDTTEASNYIFPVSMIYDYPLETNAPWNEYSLCPSYLEALDRKDNLEENRCFLGDCPSYADDKVICPSGFWGYRHSIGMPLGSFDETNHEIFYRRVPEITVAVYPSFKEWPQHERALKTITHGMVWNFADTREKTINYLKLTSPNLFYFYCHGGVERATPTSKLEKRRRKMASLLTIYLRKKLYGNILNP